MFNMEEISPSTWCYIGCLVVTSASIGVVIRWELSKLQNHGYQQSYLITQERVKQASEKMVSDDPPMEERLPSAQGLAKKVEE